MTRRIAIMILTGSGLALAAPPPKALPPDAPPPKLLEIYRPGSDPARPPLPAGFLYAVRSFVFSPDEQWLAVSLRPRAMQAGVTPAMGKLDTTLLLLPLRPADGRRVEIDPGPPGFEGAGPSEAVLWSPDSQSVVVHTNLGTGRGAPMISNLGGELVYTGPQSGYHLGIGQGAAKIYNLRGELVWTGPQSGYLLGFIAPGLLLAPGD
jgi:hypothetical protein